MSTKVRAALKMSSLTPDGKVTKAQGVVDNMQASGNFPANDMPISYTRLQAFINNLHDSILATNSGSPGSISNMHEQERILVNAFNFIKSHVEYVANNTLDPATVIVSAGMQVAVVGGGSTVTELTLETSGNGKITVRVPRASTDKAFAFETSLDGSTFTKATSSSLSKVTIGTWAPATTVYIRYYGIGKTGETAVSQAKSIIVL
jgi:hypothetical protein